MMKQKNNSHEALPIGFTDPVTDSRETYKAVLNAITRPGLVQTIGARLHAPDGINPATAAVCLAFLDSSTPIWVNGDTDSKTKRWLELICGAPVIKAPGKAALALINATGIMPSPDIFYSPYQRRRVMPTTMVIQVGSLNNDGNWVLSGPEIKYKQNLTADGLTPEFLQIRNKMSSLFPNGIDMLLTSGRKLAAINRAISIK